MSMNTKEVRSAFIDFFKENGHRHVESSSLVPHDDPSLLFVNAGMVQFKDYFTGAIAPKFTRAVSSQKCLRAGGKHNDLENVGYTARHHTFFEMLGNFSFGDYFKEDAIKFAWDCITNVYCLDPDLLYVTVYHEDLEARDIWRKVANFPDSKIIGISTSDNFWSMGDYGPCGPCSEIFYDHGSHLPGGLPGTPDEDGDRFVEIWNIVFMQYEKLKDGSMRPLSKPSIDTGMGLERISAVMQGVTDNYDIDLFKRLISASKELSGNLMDSFSHRVVADHIRAIAFLISDGVLPGNEGREYVLRRIMRRGMRHMKKLSSDRLYFESMLPVLIDEMRDAYPSLSRAQALISATIVEEQKRFSAMLDNGMKILEQNISPGATLSGDVAFKLYDTYGFPLDLTQDILRENNMDVDSARFDECMEAQRSNSSWKGSQGDISDKALHDHISQFLETNFLGYESTSCDAAEVLAIIQKNDLVDFADSGEAYLLLDKTVFYGESGGQIGDTGFIGNNPVLDTKKVLTKYFLHLIEVEDAVRVGDLFPLTVDSERRWRISCNHSATHILNHVLRDYLGDHVSQKGSVVYPDRFRFDFSHNSALSAGDISEIELCVNKFILSNDNSITQLKNIDDAFAGGAIGLFGEKYDDVVRVVSMGESVELCGGTHVTNTSEIGCFKIISEASISSGVRRIEAVTGLDAIAYYEKRMEILKSISDDLKCSVEDLPDRVKSLQERAKELKKDVSKLRISSLESSSPVLDKFEGADVMIYTASDIDMKDLRDFANKLVSKFANSLIILCVDNGNERLFVVASSTANISAKNVLEGSIIGLSDARGGGNQRVAQAKGTKKLTAQEILNALKV